MKKITTLIFSTILLLSLTACSGNEIVSDNNAVTPLMQDLVDDAGMPSNASEKIAFSAVQLAEKDFMFVLTLPELEKYKALDSNVYASIYIRFGENNEMMIVPNGYEGNQDYRIRLGGFIGGEEGYDCYMAGEMVEDTVKVIFRVPEEAGFDWDAINEFVISYPIDTQGLTTSVTLKKTEVEVSPNQLASPTPLNELNIDDAVISISAKDNGDNTVTLTYNDSSITPEYIYPWEWVDKDMSANMTYTWSILGAASDNRDDRVFESNIYNESKKFTYGASNIGLWNGMTVNIADMFRNNKDSDVDVYFMGPDVTATVDDSGLTLVWKETVYEGRSVEELEMFFVTLTYRVSGYNTNEEFVYTESRYNIAVDGTMR